MTDRSEEIDERKWRVGKHFDIHIYAEENVPIATAMTWESAHQIVAEHNLMREIRSNPERYILPKPKEE